MDFNLDPGPVQTLDERFDFRFVINRNPEPDDPSTLYFITQIETFDGYDLDVIDSWTCEDPWGAVEAAREAQAYTLEERWSELYLERGF
jgi:hypothetical protein